MAASCCWRTVRRFPFPVTRRRQSSGPWVFDVSSRMADLSHFDPNGVSNPKNNIFGLPTNEEEARLIILPVPWEVTVSYGAGTSRACEHLFRASMQVDLHDNETGDAWRQGIYMRQYDKKLLMKSDYLRKEAERYIDLTSKGEHPEQNSFMSKSLKE